MQREIKFRAYHKPSKRTFPVFSITPEYLFENTMDGIWTSKTNPADRADCELLQFTGMKDMEGFEIYEGDIVNDYVVNTNCQIVFTDCGNWGLKPINFKVQNLEYETIDPSYASTTLAVIGNIYQNPELLQP